MQHTGGSKFQGKEGDVTYTVNLNFGDAEVTVQDAVRNDDYFLPCSDDLDQVSVAD